MNESLTQTLIETIRDWRSPDLQVDSQQRLVTGIALAGRESANGYTYTEAALREAVSLYESRPVFLDHAVAGGRPLARSTRDLVGSVVAPRYEEGRIRADIRVLDTEAGRTFLALAAADTPAVGMSHVVRATRSADLARVESIHEVISVDAVAFPATTRGFREHTAHSPALPSPPPGSIEAVLPELDALLPGHVARLAAVASPDARRVGIFPCHVLIECRAGNTPVPQFHLVPWSCEGGKVELGEPLVDVPPDRLTDSAWLAERTHAARADAAESPATTGTTACSECERLRTELAAAEQRCRTAECGQRVEQLLRESQLPAEAITEIFREQLLAAADESALQQLLADRLTLVGQRGSGEATVSTHRQPAARGSRILSAERRQSSDGAAADSALIAAIRRR